jgi:tetratricopeptide (TPR) repeat protein
LKTFALLAALVVVVPVWAAEPSAVTKKLTEVEEAQARGWLVMARQLLDEAALLDAEAPNLLFLRAMQEFREGQPRRAESFARAALRKRERVADCHTLLGLIALRTKEYPEAERQIRMALASDPADGRGYYNLSEVLRWKGQPQDAIAQLQIAIEKQPGPHRSGRHHRIHQTGPARPGLDPHRSRPRPRRQKFRPRLRRARGSAQCPAGRIFLSPHGGRSLFPALQKRTLTADVF